MGRLQQRAVCLRSRGTSSVVAKVPSSDRTSRTSNGDDDDDDDDDDHGGEDAGGAATPTPILPLLSMVAVCDV